MFNNLISNSTLFANGKTKQNETTLANVITERTRRSLRLYENGQNR